MHLFIDSNWLKTSVQRDLKINICRNGKLSDIRESSKGKYTYVQYLKTEFESEKYLNLLPKKFRTTFIKF